MDSQRRRALQLGAKRRRPYLNAAVIKALDELLGICDVYADYWQNNQAKYGDILDSMDNARAALDRVLTRRKT